MAIRIPPFGAVFMKGRGKLRAKSQPKAAKLADAENPKPARKTAGKKAEPAAAEILTAESVAAAAPKRRGRPAKKAAESMAETKPTSRGRKKASTPEE